MLSLDVCVCGVASHLVRESPESSMRSLGSRMEICSRQLPPQVREQFKFGFRGFLPNLAIPTIAGGVTPRPIATPDALRRFCRPPGVRARSQGPTQFQIDDFGDMGN